MAKTTYHIDEYGRYILSSSDVVKAFLQNGSIDGIYCEDEQERDLYNKYSEQVLGTHKELLKPDINMSVDEYYEQCVNTWFIPDEYFEIDVGEYLIHRCETNEQLMRVAEELQLFEEKGVAYLLNVFIYIVDIMKENDIVWGVGRGSSVASYCLYLIGVHRIDSILYDLDIREFLK